MPYQSSPQYQEYLSFIYRALSETGKSPTLLSESTDLVADMNLSSLQVMELIANIEDEFDLSVPLNILPDIRTVGDLARKLYELNQ